MQKKITSTDAVQALGYGCSRNLYRVSSGAYAGRLAALVQTSINDIRLFFADAPYTSWSNPVTVADDTSDDAVNSCMDDDGNLYVVYAQSGTGYLMLRELQYLNGSWTPQTPVVIHDGAMCGRPSITREPSGKLWVSYSRWQPPYRNVHVKSSIDGGVTWGSGTSDPGDQFSSGAMETRSQLLTGPNSTFLLYLPGTDKACFRAVAHDGEIWSDEETVIAPGDGFFMDFDAAVAPDGRLGMVATSGSLMYREYDGNNWGAVQTLDQCVATAPQIFFRRNVPVVVYEVPWVNGKGLLKYVQRVTSSFSLPAVLDASAAHYNRVVLYHQQSASYADLTTAAQNITEGDVIHPISGRLLCDAGDALYLGMDNRFRYFECRLSVPGSGGALVYSYWDGAEWRAFTPVSGSINLDMIDNEIVLWADYSSIPTDWQKRTVNGANHFWVKVEVVSAFATGPAASFVTGISDIRTISFRR